MSVYRGRFAPSPTGPLHFGSLVAAAASWLDARAARGEWLVRVEDLDTPRCVPGAVDDILRTLEDCGLTWDDPVDYQSRRIPLYEAALDRLKSSGRAYLCGCSRREVEDRYPGTCRNGLPEGRPGRSWRFLVEPGLVEFVDRLQGPQGQNVETEVGDFVLLRADGIFAYQLAVVVDDAEQRITDIVRGADLLDSTARQILLQQALGAPRPTYLHVPVAANIAGEKLSKQTLAAPAGPEALPDVLRFLGLAPPLDLHPQDLMRWAIPHWSVTSLPARQAIPLPDGPWTSGTGESPRAKSA